LGLR
jgi:hypothetical protein